MELAPFFLPQAPEGLFFLLQAPASLRPRACDVLLLVRGIVIDHQVPYLLPCPQLATPKVTLVPARPETCHAARKTPPMTVLCRWSTIFLELGLGPNLMFWRYARRRNHRKNALTSPVTLQSLPPLANRRIRKRRVSAARMCLLIISQRSHRRPNLPKLVPIGRRQEVPKCYNVCRRV